MAIQDKRLSVEVYDSICRFIAISYSPTIWRSYFFSDVAQWCGEHVYAI